MTRRVSARARWIANIVAIAVTLAIILALQGVARAQTSGQPLIKIPPAQLPPLATSPPAAMGPASAPPVPAAVPIQPAARTLLPTGVQVLRDSRGTGLAMYGALTGRATSATGVILAIFANSEAFDPRPSLRLMLADERDRRAQALFTATVHGAPVIGIAVAALNDNGGDATVLYDEYAAFAISFPRMRKALAQSGGVGTTVLSPLHLSDGNEIDLPPGWRVTAQGTGSVDLRGPQGEFMSLGGSLPVYAGSSGGLLKAPCCDPQQALETLYPQIAAAEQHTGAPPRQLTGIVETQPVPIRSGNAALILASLQAGDEDYAYLALAEAIPGFTDPWTFTLSGVMAPQAIFAAEFPTLLQIWKSYRGAEPVFGNNVWQALQSISATGQLLKSTIAAHETDDYNAAPDWNEAIAAVVTAKSGPIDNAVAQSLTDRLAGQTGQSWKIVPPASYK
jgi:hypothetical protein